MEKGKKVNKRRLSSYLLGSSMIFASISLIFSSNSLTLLPVIFWALAGLSWIIGCAFLAEYKGYNSTIGLLLGFSNIVGLIILLLLPNKEMNQVGNPKK